jgi:hypothetical protein
MRSDQHDLFVLRTFFQAKVDLKAPNSDLRNGSGLIELY